jgi:hypothetical protein
VPVGSGENISLLAMPVADNGVYAQQKARYGLSFQLGDLLACMSNAAFSVDSRLFCRLVVQTRCVNNALNLPRRNTVVLGVSPPIERQELHFTVARVLPSEYHNPLVLPTRVLPSSSAPRCP